MPPVLWLVDPSLHTPEEQGVAAILEGWPGPWRLFRPGLSDGDDPHDALAPTPDGVVVMGSAASVHDDRPWIGRLAAWLRPLLDGSRPTPVLGICFGHQLIAHLAGASVAFFDERRTKTQGVETSRLDGGRLLRGAHELRVVVSHREHVTSVPAGYRVVAARAGCPVDGIEHERLPIHSFQFHPEARDDFATRSGIDPARIDERVIRDSQRLLGAFRQEVLRGI